MGINRSVVMAGAGARPDSESCASLRSIDARNPGFGAFFLPSSR